MRHVILGFALVIVIGGTAFAQEPAPMLAVESCTINSGETAEATEALQALVDYLTANPQDLPGSVYGVFREVAAAGNTMSFALEVDTLGEFQEFILARIEANNSSEQRGDLFRAWRSHLDVRSCDWSFHLRIP